MSHQYLGGCTKTRHGIDTRDYIMKLPQLASAIIRCHGRQEQLVAPVNVCYILVCVVHKLPVVASAFRGWTFMARQFV